MGKLLDDFLTANKKDKATISRTLYSELVAVENELLKRLDAIKHADQTIRDNAININSISKATGISRKTFYNNDILKGFVTANATVDVATKEVTSTLKEKLSDLESKLSGLLYRDIDEITTRNEITKLQQELEYAHKRIQTLEQQHEEDMRRLNQPVTRNHTYYT